MISKYDAIKLIDLYDTIKGYGDVQLSLFERWGFRPPAVLEKLFAKQEG